MFKMYIKIKKKMNLKHNILNIEIQLSTEVLMQESLRSVEMTLGKAFFQNI